MTIGQHKCPTISVIRTHPRHPDVFTLLQEADARSASLYPAESRHNLNVEALIRENVRVFVAYNTQLIAGCGGFQTLGPTCAELKRLFVTASMRRQRVGYAILTAVEAAAKLEGIEIMKLETGVKSLEALQLYRRCGYVERGPFSKYRPDPMCVFMEKRLKVVREEPA